jgi:hypothetical protein
MKKKAFDKRLVLKKKTIANLDNNEMKGLHGGGGLTTPTKCRMATCPKTCFC